MQYFEVKAGGVSLGLTKFLDEAERWYAKVAPKLSAELLSVPEGKEKTIIKWRNWNGYHGVGTPSIS